MSQSPAAALASSAFIPPSPPHCRVAAAVVLTGVVMLIVAPSDPSKYIDIPNSAVGTITEFAALIFGVWLSTLEFSAGTMQRTLTAEPNRSRVLSDKLVSIVGFGAGLLTRSFGAGIAIALVSTVIWCLILIVPGWIRFLRGDLK